MKVKITHGQGSFWYEHKVGEVFEVEEERSFGDFRVKGKELNIAVEDCAPVDDEVFVSKSTIGLLLNRD